MQSISRKLYIKVKLMWRIRKEYIRVIKANLRILKRNKNFIRRIKIFE